MERTDLQNQMLSLTQQNMEAYFKTHDVRYVAEDSVFRNMVTGEQYQGRAEIGGMLHFMYHVAFDARAETTNYVITENMAVAEGFFTGKHIGEFAGIQPTLKEVRVPLCVTYDLEEGQITEARIYLLTDILMQQLAQR